MTQHRLKASVQNCHWGYFDATRAPVLTVESGDQVTIDCVSGVPAVVPKSGFHVPPELLEVHAANPGYPFGPHILTGPIAVKGAKPGRVLEVRILDVHPRPCCNPAFSGRTFGSNAAAWWGFHCLYRAAGD